VSEKVAVFKYSEDLVTKEEDEIAVEEPLKMTVRYGDKERTIYIMRTPTHDTELAVGFLYTQGIVGKVDEIKRIDIKGEEITVWIDHPFTLEREALVNSSCGVCGNPTLLKVMTKKSQVKVKADVLMNLPNKMIKMQRIFRETGGLHGAGAFDVNGNPLLIEEDVGRHNAVDKVIGRLLLKGVDPSSLILQVSGRAGYEIAEKAAVAGFPVLSAVSAPTTSAVKMCELTGISLVGFVRGNRMNVYTHPERIVSDT
jgi:FdhD protein